MDKESVVRNFVENRPNANGAYGYGSGVFRQAGYDKGDPQIDLIFLVDDLKDWHSENLERNRGDYSLLGRLHVNNSSSSKLKGYNGITYYSQIFEEGYRFKYGVMEERDFLDELSSWRNFFVAGRFQKPVMEIKGNIQEKEVIERNRKHAFLVTALLAPRTISKKNFLKLLCGLSYKGTMRMNFAENPHKVENIVNGSYGKLLDMYAFDTDYVYVTDDDELIINEPLLLKHIKELPIGLLVYLYRNGYNFKSIADVRKGIKNFLYEHNKNEEIHQSIDGIKTNGIVRSVPYLLAKVKKRISHN